METITFRIEMPDASSMEGYYFLIVNDAYIQCNRFQWMSHPYITLSVYWNQAYVHQKHIVLAEKIFHDISRYKTNFLIVTKIGNVFKLEVE